MTEPTIDPTGAASATGSDDTRADGTQTDGTQANGTQVDGPQVDGTRTDDTRTAASHRVSGHVPMTVTVTAGGTDEATAGVTAAIAAVFADLAGVTLTPELYAVGSPQLVEQAAGADEPGRCRIQVTVYGHLDVVADDHTDAVIVAEETLLAHLAGRADVTADWTFATCDDVTPLAAGGTAR